MKLLSKVKMLTLLQKGGGATLGDDTARVLVYCVINQRLLNTYKASLRAPRVAGQFRLGWG